jgi:nitrate/TMAO reductase-like tetraheme cytochrome c subunit
MSRFRSAAIVSAAAVFGGFAAMSGCTSKSDAGTTLTRDELLDPTTCGRCHEDHYREWSGSMHAYAAEDPVFLAMNQRLQRETNGELGDFCVKCHAPMAVRDGLTKDGLNLAELPEKYKGVTCYFCHTVEDVGQLHNNGLIHADEPVMRGSFSDAVRNDAHRSQASRFHDQRVLDSSNMCGSCHDIVTPGGAHIERTFAEWKESLFATETGQTCGQCHMKSSVGVQPIANVPGVFARTMHSHTFAGVDRAVTPWPNMQEQKEEIQELLDASIQASLCVSRSRTVAKLRIVVDNVFAGHNFPSGSASDRRVWPEIIAFQGDKVVYQTGVVPPGQAVKEGSHDPDLWLLRDKLFDATGKETHLFGHATCYESRLLPFPVTANPADPAFYQRNIVRDFPFDGTPIPLPDKVTMRIRIMPIGLEVLDDLIASGDLDPVIRERMEAMDVGPLMVWTAETAQLFEEQGTRILYECVTKTNQDFRANKFPPPEVNTCR